MMDGSIDGVDADTEIEEKDKPECGRVECNQAALPEYCPNEAV